MQTGYIVLSIIAILATSHTLTEIFRIRAKRYNCDNSQTQELQELKERVAALEQKIEE